MFYLVSYDYINYFCTQNSIALSCLQICKSCTVRRYCTYVCKMVTVTCVNKLQLGITLILLSRVAGGVGDYCDLIYRRLNFFALYFIFIPLG